MTRLLEDILFALVAGSNKERSKSLSTTVGDITYIEMAIGNLVHIFNVGRQYSITHEVQFRWLHRQEVPTDNQVLRP